MDGHLSFLTCISLSHFEFKFNICDMSYILYHVIPNRVSKKFWHLSDIVTLYQNLILLLVYEMLPWNIILPGGSDGKESACNVGDLCLIPGLGRSPGGRHGNPLQYSCLENPHGQRSLAGYSPWGCTELDMTKRLSTDHRTWYSS